MYFRLGLTCVVFGATLSGCRGRAVDDLYQAKMANQIRVLEDQLYDADYQNRVLRDQLTRAGDSEQIDQAPSIESMPRPVPDAVPRSPHEANMDLNEPDTAVEAGPPPAPDQVSPEKTAGSVDEPKPLIDPPPEGLGVPREGIPDPVPDATNNQNSDLPAPTDQKPPPELIPPAEGQLMDDQIIPGEKRPPSADQDSQDKIEIPAGSKKMQLESDAEPTEEPAKDSAPAIPDHLELHDGLSGGHQFDTDSDIDGLYLVITVADKAGHALSLDDFDVDADLTVVVVDPHDESEDARIGRWEFSPEEVRQFVRRTPVDGIHIPIMWQDRIPSGDDVTVHIRMAAAEDEMRCQAKIRLEETVASANWLPRG